MAGSGSSAISQARIEVLDETGARETKSRGVLNERALGIGRLIFGWHLPFHVAQIRDARARSGKRPEVGVAPATVFHVGQALTVGAVKGAAGCRPVRAPTLPARSREAIRRPEPGLAGSGAKDCYSAPGSPCSGRRKPPQAHAFRPGLGAVVWSATASSCPASLAFKDC